MMIFKQLAAAFLLTISPIATTAMAGAPADIDRETAEAASVLEERWADANWVPIANSVPFGNITYTKYVRAAGDGQQTRFCAKSRTSTGEYWYTANAGRDGEIDRFNPQLKIVFVDGQITEGNEMQFMAWNNLCTGDGIKPPDEILVVPPQKIEHDA